MRKSISLTNKKFIKNKSYKKVIRKPSFWKIFLARLFDSFVAATVILCALVYARRYVYEDWLLNKLEEFDVVNSYPDGTYVSVTERSYKIAFEEYYKYIYNTLPNRNESYKSLSDEDKKLLYRNGILAKCSVVGLMNYQKSYINATIYDEDHFDKGIYTTSDEPNTLLLGVDMSNRPFGYGVIYKCQDEKVSEAIEEISNDIDRSYNRIDVLFSVDGVYLKDDYTFVADKIKVTYVINGNDVNGYGGEFSDSYSEYITMDLPSKEEMEKQGYTYSDYNSEENLSVYYTSLPKGVDSIPALTTNLFQPLKLSTLVRHRPYDFNLIEDNHVYKCELDIVEQFSYLKHYAEDGLSIYPDKEELTNFKILRRDAIVLYSSQFLVTLLLSITTYLKWKNVYEMDTYRRELTNVMAHDLKTPLMVLRGNAENLVDVMKSDEESEIAKGERYAGNIMTNVDYMTALINQTLTLSSLESGNGVLEKKELSIRELLEGLVDSSKAIREERDIDVQIIGDDKLILADEFWISEAFRNIFDNAAKYADQGSILQVEIEKNKIIFSNPAKDLCEEDVRNIANPFFKKNRARSGKKGSGIGMTIVKNTVELHGWKMKTYLDDGIFVVEINGIKT